MSSQIISPKEFAERMQQIWDATVFNWANGCEDYDTEMRHIRMDELLASTLESLGYGEGIAIYNNAGKWYA